jgi:hypothetical protein
VPQVYGSGHHAIDDEGSETTRPRSRPLPLTPGNTANDPAPAAGPPRERRAILVNGTGGVLAFALQIVNLRLSFDAFSVVSFPRVFANCTAWMMALESILDARSWTKERSILILSKGKFLKLLNEEWPVPKSSITMRTASSVAKLSCRPYCRPRIKGAVCHDPEVDQRFPRLRGMWRPRISSQAHLLASDQGW